MNILGWATASQQKALDNARAAAVECSRRMVERAEVAQAVAHPRMLTAETVVNNSTFANPEMCESLRYASALLPPR